MPSLRVQDLEGPVSLEQAATHSGVSLSISGLPSRSSRLGRILSPAKTSVSIARLVKEPCSGVDLEMGQGIISPMDSIEHQIKA